MKQVFTCKDTNIASMHLESNGGVLENRSYPERPAN